MSLACTEVDTAVTVTVTEEVKVNEGLQDEEKRRLAVLAQVYRFLRQLDKRRHDKSLKTRGET